MRAICIPLRRRLAVVYEPVRRPYPVVWSCLLLASALLLAVAPAHRAEHSPVLADLDRDKLLDSLNLRLARTRAGEPLEVIVTFRVPLEAVNVPLIQAQIGAFAPATPLRLVRSVATRLTRPQILALARAGIVERIQADERIYALRITSQQYFGVSRARAGYGLTGDGDGRADVFTREDNTIAIVDTGIDDDHIELAGGKVIGWKDLINDRPEPYDDSRRTVNGQQIPLGHGTHVASIAAGRVNGEQGGVAPGAALVGVKVLDADGAGSLSTVARGIEWCVANRATYGIRVINLSVGSSFPSSGDDIVSQAADAAVAAGIAVVCAAGNSGPGRYTVGSPAAARRVLTVGAVADPGEGGIYLPSWSSRGPTLDGRVKPDLLAPGVGITAARVGTTSESVTFSGTSMATPFVAGFAALLFQQDRSRTPDQVYERLTMTARDFGPAGPDLDYGYGVLDGARAIDPAAPAGPGVPRFPAHSVAFGNITRDTRAVSHPIHVASTEFAIAVALVIPNWVFGTPDLDVELLDPTGARVALSNGVSRQETIVWKPATTGTYTLRVYGYRPRDRGAYFFDVSADIGQGSAGPPPGGPAFPP